MSATLERMKAVFRDVFDDEDLVVQPETTAADVEAWDSLTHINLIVATEREFKVKFTTAEVTSLKNVGDLTALIDKKLGSPRSALSVSGSYVLWRRLPGSIAYVRCVFERLFSWWPLTCSM